MALVKCNECGNKVSSKANSCPKCGAPPPPEPPKSKVSIGHIFLVLSLFVSACLIWGSVVEKNRKAEEIKKADLAYYTNHKSKVTSEIRKRIDEGDYAEALKISQPYLDSNDKQLLALKNEAQEKQLREKVAKIPANEWEKNRDGYAQLIKLNPKEALYRKKHNFYQAKIERQDRIQSQFSILDGSHHALEKYIKSRMNDPTSYKHVKTIYSDQGKSLYVLTRYRGKNAFGGLITEELWAEVSLDGKILDVKKAKR